MDSSARKQTVPSASATFRIASIDAYRGLVMFLMMAEVLSFSSVAKALPESVFWKFLAHHQTHADWIGCTLHDLIQPSFVFLVGVALPYSLAKRMATGQPRWRQTAHAFGRALTLVLLGVFLQSLHADYTRWTLIDTLSQIGLGYGFLFLLGLRSARVQWLTFALLLVGYWLLFTLYPLPDKGFGWAAAGTQPERMLSGFAEHWSLGTNPAAAFDRWFVALFPAERRASNPAGYTTLNFILTFATMILGLLAGGVLRGERPPAAKILWFLVAGLAALALGWVLNETGICPMVKKTRTPSFVLFSGGWCFLFLAFFYQVVDVWGRRKWAFPLLVLGMNSIAAYLISHVWAGFITRAWLRHAGKGFFAFAGAPYERLTLGCAVLLTEWLLLWWMFRNRFFLRI